MNNRRISDLLYKYTINALNDDERRELDAWVAARPDRQSYLQMLSSPQSLQDDYRRRKSIDVQKAIREMEARIGKTEKASRSSGSRFPFFRIAAVLVLLLVGGTFWYHRGQTRVTPPEISEEVQLAMEQSRKSGKSGAEVLSGKAVEEVMSTEERALYHVDDNFAEQLEEARRITTYQNKEYWVTLDDGTLVHLNYDSRLIYPEHFGDRRDVILDGEAYFMVAKDKSRQFVVHTPQGDVKVYGTEFVVNTRKSDAEDHKDMYVVLVKGSVGFTANDGREQMLTPGQELSMVHSQLTVTDIDTAPFVAWNEGEFVFNNWSLERIMSVISRWYGLKVEFSNSSLGGRKFSGSLSRYDDIKPTIETIETVTGTTITINHQTLNIYQNK